MFAFIHITFVMPTCQDIVVHVLGVKFFVGTATYG